MKIVKNVLFSIIITLSSLAASVEQLNFNQNFSFNETKKLNIKRLDINNKIELGINSMLRLFYMEKTNKSFDIKYSKIENLNNGKSIIHNLSFINNNQETIIEKILVDNLKNGIFDNFTIFNMKSGNDFLEKVEVQNAEFFYNSFFNHSYIDKDIEFNVKFYNSNFSTTDSFKPYSIFPIEHVHHYEKLLDNEMIELFSFSFKNIFIDKNKIKALVKINLKSKVFNYNFDINIDSIEPEIKSQTIFGPNRVSIGKIKYNLENKMFYEKMKQNLPKDLLQSIDEYFIKLEEFRKTTQEKQEEKIKLQNKDKLRNLKLIDYYKKEILPFITNKQNRISGEFEFVKAVKEIELFLYFELIKNGVFVILKDQDDNLK